MPKLDLTVAAAIEAVRRELLPVQGPLLRITIPAAGVDFDVAHGLQATPNAYVVEYADGPVYARPGAWATRDVAYLRAANANTHALVRFRVIQEGLHA